MSSNKSLIDWQQHVEGYRRSGLSREEYCKEHGLKVHQLAYHQTKLRKLARIGEFAQVVAVESAPVPGPSAAKVFFGSGLIIEFVKGSDPLWAAQMISGLGRGVR